MKRLLFLIFLFPVLSMAQVNITVSNLPDTIMLGHSYEIILNINPSNDFSSLQLSITKPNGIVFRNIRVIGAKIKDYPNVLNIIWAPYSMESGSSVKINFYVDKKVEQLRSEIFFNVVVSYLTNGLKGEQNYRYKYILRRKNDQVMYVLEY